MNDRNSVNDAAAGEKITARKPVLLFVEDDADDLYICQTAFAREKLAVEVRVVYTVAEAIDWLTGKTPFNNRELFPVPDLIVSDLKTPALEGSDLLRYARGTPVYRQMPIIINSGTFELGQSADCMKLGATACIEKDPTCRKLVEAIKHAIGTLV